MAKKKLQAMAEGKTDLNQLATAIRESAQQIWLAGLGAFSKAQEEGGKVFETLVKEGLSIQRRTRSATEEKLGEGIGKVSKAAGDITKQAAQSWDKLEQVFEDRVSRALTRLGVPTSREIDELVARIDSLNDSVQSMNGSSAKRPAHKSTAAKAASSAPRKAAPRGPRVSPGAATKASATGNSAARRTGRATGKASA